MYLVNCSVFPLLTSSKRVIGEGSSGQNGNSFLRFKDSSSNLHFIICKLLFAILIHKPSLIILNLKIQEIKPRKDLCECFIFANSLFQLFTKCQNNQLTFINILIILLIYNFLYTLLCMYFKSIQQTT